MFINIKREREESAICLSYLPAQNRHLYSIPHSYKNLRYFIWSWELRSFRQGWRDNKLEIKWKGIILLYFRLEWRGLGVRLGSQKCGRIGKQKSKIINALWELPLALVKFHLSLSKIALLDLALYYRNY